LEFHISRRARDFYKFDQSLFSFNGNAIFANFHAVRLFTQKINQKKDLVTFPEQAVKAGQINAMGLIDEILHYVISLYCRQNNPNLMDNALATLEETIGSENLDNALFAFTNQFPPTIVYQQQKGVAEYLDASTEGRSNRAIALEELLLLWVTNKNPATLPYSELFADQSLISETVYSRIIKVLYTFLDSQPHFGPDNQNLMDMLRAPAIAVPHSLTGQLEYIRTHWTELLGSFLYRLLSSLDLIAEEEKLSFGGPGIIPVPDYRSAALNALDLERFSADSEWMTRLVLIARNSYVWLDQLTKKYNYPITRLDQIPDEELDILASRGINGLWLIGLWERSASSAHIKQMCGNPEAIASAYSLAGYWIANDLGGEEAYANLRDRAWRRGIRLASDMVPNHMGIDSPWVIEHPEWFLSLDYSPFPAYTFNGPNLSQNPGVGIYLEDHYYNRTDASVVFKRVDFNNNQTKYIYHGNDGTSMPWNDTAQLNYLNPQAREAVIQQILEVARKFPIIRFDAAMTLAKKHIQRLWFPEPGSGGAIPSRSDHSLTKEQFDQLLPIEFWREVVDRCAAEVPDTLLLAEAFWLMEGYFVRTLGMHRVYNSAFMHLLRNEDNAKYRQVMKNTLEFEPEILKRFVNFMNNPDELTAIEQFGKGDKYFGICTMMVTLPGLPMFGHGQIEGFSEKYGMEYRRAYWDEHTDQSLVERHQRQIFPLCHQRSLFAGVENFLLYDFITPQGYLNEDVFAYSNGLGNERVLVICHNRFADTRGYIKTSVSFNHKGGGSNPSVIQKDISQGLLLKRNDQGYLIYRDRVTGLEFIRPVNEVMDRGFYVELSAYEHHVFHNFKQVQENQYNSYRHLCEYLNGRGVPSIEEAQKELLLQPVLTPFRQISNPGYFNYLLSSLSKDVKTTVHPSVIEESELKFANLLDGISYKTGSSKERQNLLNDFGNKFEMILSLPFSSQQLPPGKGKLKRAFQFILDLFTKEQRWLALFGWLFTHSLGRLVTETDTENQSLSWLDEWQLSKVMSQTLTEIGFEEHQSKLTLSTIRMLISEQNWFESLGQKPIRIILNTWFSRAEVQQFLGFNRYNDVLWFSKERFEEFSRWIVCLAYLEAEVSKNPNAASTIERVLNAYEIANHLLKAAAKSGYQVAKFMDSIKN
jgi:glycosidase